MPKDKETTKKKRLTSLPDKLLLEFGNLLDPTSFKNLHSTCRRLKGCENVANVIQLGTDEMESRIMGQI